jgi:hypothetical protein
MCVRWPILTLGNFHFRQNITEICPSSLPLTPHSTPSTPLLPALTLSAGECKMSTGESKVSRVDGWACLATHTLLARKGLKMVSLYCLVASSGLLLCRHGGATGFLLRVYGPCRCLQDGCRIWVCPLRLFCLSCPIYLKPASLLSYFLRPPTAMAKKKITGDELSARAKENGYQRGAHRDEDSLRD